MQTILITGANRGIGLELSRHFATAGWRVFACCRDPAKATELAKLQKGSGGAVSLHALEVTDQASIERLAAALSDEALDALVNNAGVDGRKAGSIGATDTKAWLETFAINSIAPMHMAEAFLPHLARGKRKIIATISSRMGSVAENSGGSYAYRASKAAVNSVMKGLSVDLKGKGITAVTLHPGWVRTDMGGPSAPVAPSESASGLLQVISGLKPADSGKFLSFDGSAIPW
jgi:NAD(P)-dependent dehydrogenase (short-subunit alcohol dehydrogenase family)